MRGPYASSPGQDLCPGARSDSDLNLNACFHKAQGCRRVNLYLIIVLEFDATVLYALPPFNKAKQIELPLDINLR